jgi:hypothetical protein
VLREVWSASRCGLELSICGVEGFSLVGEKDGPADRGVEQNSPARHHDVEGASLGVAHGALKSHFL